MATTSPAGIYYRTQAEARPTDEAMALSLANSVDKAVGLVPVVPTSVVVGGGSASVNGDGVVSLTSAYDIRVNGVFSSLYKNYLVLVNYTSCNSTPSIFMKMTSGGVANSAGYVYSGWRVTQSGSGVYMSSGSNGSGVYITEADVNQSGGSARSEVTVFNPYDSSHTVVNAHGQGGYFNQGYNMILTSGIHDTTSRDGFQLTHGTSAATGTVRVYGYR